MAINAQTVKLVHNLELLTDESAQGARLDNDRTDRTIVKNAMYGLTEIHVGLMQSCDNVLPECATCDDARVRLLLQRVSEGSSWVRRLQIDVLWSRVYGRNNTGAPSLRLQVLLVLLRQVQHVHQEGRRLSLPMKRPP